MTRVREDPEREKQPGLPLASVPPIERTDGSTPVVEASAAWSPSRPARQKRPRTADAGNPLKGNGAGSTKRQEGAARVKAMNQRFTQSEIRRALKGAQAAGVQVRVEIDPNGRMHVIPIQPSLLPPKETLQERIDRASW
jgi:hypothetical protein